MSSTKDIQTEHWLNMPSEQSFVALTGKQEDTHISQIPKNAQVSQRHPWLLCRTGREGQISLQEERSYSLKLKELVSDFLSLLNT